MSVGLGRMHRLVGGVAPPQPTDVAGVATAYKLGLMCSGGDLDESGFFVIPNSWNAVNDPATAWDIFSANTPDGDIHAGYDWGVSGTFTLTVRGTQVLSIGTFLGNAENAAYGPNDVFYWRFWYRVSTGECGAILRVNACNSIVKRVTASGSPLAAPTAAWIGSRFGSSRTFAGTHSAWTSHSIANSDLPVNPSPIIVFAGDSFHSAQYLGRGGTGACIIANNDARAYGDLIYSQAVPGETIANQQARYVNATIDRNAVKVVVSAAGINDLAVGTTPATMTTRKNAEAVAIRSAFPNVQKLIAMQISPCHKEMTDKWNANNSLASSAAVFWQNFLDYNQNLLGAGGGGANPVTGWDDCVTAGWGLLDTITPGYLDPAYELISGEGGHPNYAAELITGPQIRAVLHRGANGAYI